MESQDKISGTVSITKRLSVCTLKDKSLQYNQTVESYNSDCPLKNNIKEVKISHISNSNTYNII
jgi:hypothetical protein